MNIAPPASTHLAPRLDRTKPLPPSLRARGVTAVLGPTNTGKTTLAIDRMIGHSSGLIGLPLRLLAREVYTRLVERVGAGQVALITGEERIKPDNPRFWVATVEAMPRDLDVAFVALDEIQISADLDRGHVFTDRLLNRRGREETLLLGAATMRPLVEKLLPGASILVRPRLSNLTFAGEKKITRLPRRSAIVAFSADEVYAIAELIRRQRGGAAVVLGALSPRTRNAQVEMYQNGDVDYLIATDAIGMGLNLDVDHVAFAGDVKFDGWQFRKLNPGELAQIAGRAGRAQRDGTFGTTGRCTPFDAELVERLEAHSFDAHRVLQWRNSALDFASVEALNRSLAQVPREEGLTRAPTAEDVLVLEALMRDPAIRRHAVGADAVERLWEACQLPDYRKVSPASHSDLVSTVYDDLMRHGRISTDWFAKQVALADRAEGDIDTLSGRIAQVRTWTFAANRPDWLDDPEHWRGVTRRVEDRLSDALHERLTHRFVDRRTSVLMRRLRENAMLETEITKTGDVVVEGHVIGHLLGFQFAADASAAGPEAKALRTTAQKALAGEIEARAARLAEGADDAFVLSSDGTLRWVGEPVAKLIPGDEVLGPRLKVIADEHLTGPARDAVQARIELWLKAHIEKLLGPLIVLGKAEDVAGIGRGIAFQLVETLGVLERHKVAEEMKGLAQEARAVLRGHGVRFGAHHIYIPTLLKPAPRALAAQLWALKHGGLQQKGLDELPHLAASGRTSIPVDPEIQKGLYRAVGFRVAGERAVRVDILERLADLIRPALAWRPGTSGEKPAGAFDGGGFVATVAMTSLAGCAGEDFASILRSLGYRMERRPAPVEAAPVEAALVEAAPVEAVPAEAVPAVEDAATDHTAADLAEAEAPVVGTSPDEASVPAGADVAFDHTVEPALEPEAVAEIVAARAEPAPEAAVADAAGVSGEVFTDPVFDQTVEPALEAEPAADSPSAAPAEAASEDGPAQEVAVDEAIVDVAAAPDAVAQPAVPAEPAMIEVWRPGRPPGQHRPAQHRKGGQQGRPGPRAENNARAENAPRGEAAPAAAAGEEGARRERPEGERGRRPPRDDRRTEGRGEPRSEARTDGRERRPEGGDAGRPAREPRPEGGKRDDNRRDDNRRNDGRKEFGNREQGNRDHANRDHANRSSRPAPDRFTSGPRPDTRRDKPVDPDSPFAKLLALKARMEAEKNGG
ncbi:ATP-dependent RNA helicase SUPV3L1/SUV3 [Angulomicrobium tetraedrale]|uniref:ATP-dependent RNA helicase SUPV3L1/SUV3 n=1 Tax=Ancylobacter tetraedralis TaxID=217068 RepID=A0A839Z8Y4_9HYPH|nr:helicase-related protein [Ancylobacter tetraedralis]MBB3770865.1 ATP-dependent RNA helicase SUPV3L1/SUV3 [Ancylobacter tetraedralis]